MKTLKLMFVALFVVVTMVSVAQGTDVKIRPERDQRGISICLTLKQAVTVPHLIQAIYSQVDAGFLNFEHGGSYSFPIRMKGTTYMVSGTYGEWKRLFMIKPIKQNDGNAIED